MTVRFYLLPIMRPTPTSRWPKYIYHGLRNPGGTVTPTRWSLTDYGSIDLACVAIEAEQAQHTILAGYADVYQFPENLDVKMVAAQRTALSAYLEAAGVPGDWLAAQDTHRTALRTITGMFLYMQRLTAQTGNVSPLDWGYTLNTQWKNITTSHQAAITEAAVSMGYSTAFIGSNTQVRALLKNFADQWGAAPILFGFVTL